jgi:hypothetical protein
LKNDEKNPGGGFMKFWRYLFGMAALAVLASGIPGWAADVSGIEEDQKFLPSNMAVISAELHQTSEIRRPAHLTQNKKASVGLWFPLMEPPPVERTRNNMLSDRAKIFRNTGSTSGKFPFVVSDGSNFYVYRNVKYKWLFEKAEKGEDPYDGNKDGESGGGAWSPFFYENKLLEEAVTFIPDYAEEKVSASGVSEKKVFVNRHTTTYDSGVMDDESVANSKVLQQVGMILSYERAKVNVTANGAGYPEKAFDVADPGEPEYVNDLVKGTVALNTEPTDADFGAPVEVLNDIPEVYKDIWKLGKCSAYKLVYVEDHLAPDAKPAEDGGKSYAGSVGKYLEGGVKIEYIDTNPNAVHESPLKQADFKYNAGNNDIYKFPNPLYDVSVSGEEPYVYVFMLRANEEFGPYGCVAQRGRESEWYHGHHKYWSLKPRAEVDAFLRTKYSYAWDINSLPLWEIGAMYYIAYNNGTFDGAAGKKHAEQLNAAWMEGMITPTNCPDFARIMDEIEGKNSEGANLARQSLAALEKAIQNPAAYNIRADRTFTRFASAGFSPEKGSYVVGRATLEKDNPQVHREWNEVIEQDGNQIEVKKGEWTVHEKRIILPIHYSTAACDHCDLSAFSSKEVVSVSQSNCCGNSVSVDAIPTSDGITIRDDQSGSLPVPEVTLADSRSNVENSLVIPVNDTLGRDERLVVTDKRTGQKTEYSAFEYDKDFDMKNNDYAIKRSDGNLEEVKIPDNPNDPQEKDRVIFEDVRMQITLGGYDNIDGMTPFRGVGKTRFAVYELDKNGNRVKPENLEFVDDDGISQKKDFIERVNAGDPFKWTPVFRFYHIFRNPGKYEAEYEVWEHSSDAAKKSRKMVFNINVLDAKFQTRTMDSDIQRQ